MIFSVQICSYNRKDILKRSLEALFNQDFPAGEFEIIVVDDGSADGTGDMVKALNAPCGFKYIRQEHLGLSIGRNKGIREAKGKYVLFVDDDIISDKNLLKEHLKTHQKYPDSVVKGWVNHVDSLDNPQKPRFTWADISTAFFWTSNVSVEREHLLKAGLFDEDFKEYGWEDLELGLRLKKSGLVSLYNKKAVVYHYKSRWKKQDMDRLLAQAEAKARTAIIFLSKHPTLRVKLATGIFEPRLLLNNILNSGGKGFEICSAIVSKCDDAPLKGFSLLCAKKMVDFRYFDTIQKGLK